MFNTQSIPVEESKIKPDKKPGRWPGAALLVVGLVLIAALAAAGIFLDRVFGPDLAKTPRLARLFWSAPEKNLASSAGRTNFLILGIAGGEHDGADLTDTMIFVSTDIQTGDSMMMNVPRDIWIPDLVTKINSVYHYGEENGENEGFKLEKEVFVSTFGQAINYSFLVDFSTFRELIDLVGGIDVDVERTLDDRQYPVAGKEKDDCGGDPEYRCRYENLSIEKGRVHMDGTLALKYVRSRNAEGEEGTDFARSQRQQKLMMALKNKMMDKQVLTSPATLHAIYAVIKKNLVIYPALSEEELAGFAKLAWRFIRQPESIRILNLETGDDDNPGFLTSPPAEKYGQWVLEPAGGDWTKIQEFIREKIKGGY